MYLKKTKKWNKNIFTEELIICILNTSLEIDHNIAIHISYDKVLGNCHKIIKNNKLGLMHLYLKKNKHNQEHLDKLTNNLLSNAILFKRLFFIKTLIEDYSADINDINRDAKYMLHDTIRCDIKYIDIYNYIISIKNLDIDKVFFDDKDAIRKDITTLIRQTNIDIILSKNK